MLENRFVGFEPGDKGADLVGAAILVDDNDSPGVKIAAENLAGDFASVTGGNRSVVTVVPDAEELPNTGTAKVAIIVGCIEASPLLQRLERQGQVDFRPIRGKWESFLTTVVDRPFGGCYEKALVIAGSDKRGAIFGIYTLSEQIGVSPWYWWADVPATHNRTIYAIPVTTTQGEPSVKFRGIFLNDEAPALTGWVLEKFGSYNSAFYRTVFELLLRLKANFMWPAMWPGYPNPGANFFLDDPDNPRVADEYGIVISTSHHEPMQRLTNEWFLENGEGSWDWETNRDKMTEFFREGARRARGYDSYFTIGLRGAYDRRLSGADPAAVLNDVIETQRGILDDVYGRSEDIPQLLALYRDIEHIYDEGRVDVPDDVTLLFQDDNNGTIRRLPTKKEAARKGGAGIYYHFEYVGLPRSYKWINSVSLGKAWHQLRYAYSRNVRRLWLFNVGDLKPLEMPITGAMSLAWNIHSVAHEAGGLRGFLRDVAARDFGTSLGREMGDVYHGYDRLVSMRKHELIEPDTLSLLHHREAERVLAAWTALLAAAQAVYARCAEEQKPAAYQLVLHPVRATRLLVALRVAQARNRLYARQRRNSANVAAAEALALFDADFDAQRAYHALLGGRWAGMLRQPHLGHDVSAWHAPSRDMVEGLCYVQRRQDSSPAVGQMGVSVEGHAGVRPGLVNEESDRTRPSRRDLVPGLTLGAVTRYGPPSRWFEVWTRGTPAVRWTAAVAAISSSLSSSCPWLRLSCCSGVLVPGEEDARVDISVDWDQVPNDFDDEVLIDVRSDAGDFEQVHLPVNGHRVPSSFRKGFVEGPGYVSMPGPSGIAPGYVVMPDTGRSPHGSIGLALALDEDEDNHKGKDKDRDEDGNTPDGGDDGAGHFLTYPFYQFSDTTTTTTATARITLEFGITLSTSPEDTTSYDLQVDDGAVTRHSRLERFTDESVAYGTKLGVPRAAGWLQGAADLVWRAEHHYYCASGAAGEAAGLLGPGPHVVRIRLRHVNMLLEKVVVDFGAAVGGESYLGPPASYEMGGDE
ncbi:glycoside hydrolase [Purpureocillium lavendulum]|uniref:Glycoside hydrolase n=1 Tax=Purpureocillium lavendulum TaxID=1247861 RepID=A0AB34FT79_9HYPO|nr:glycoside hydrolase [Purpureocillium lavendulum]